MNQGARQPAALSVAALSDCLRPANGAPYSVERYVEIFGLSPAAFAAQIDTYRHQQPGAASASDAEAAQRFIADVLQVILAVAASPYRSSNSGPRSNWSAMARSRRYCSFWPPGKPGARDESGCPAADRSATELPRLLPHRPARRGCALRRSRFCTGGDGEGLPGAARHPACGATGAFRAVRASRSDGLPGKGHGHAAVWSQGALFAARVPLLRRDRSRQVMAGLFRPHSRRLAGAAPAM